MCDVDEMFDCMRNDIERAQRDFHAANPDGVDYFLARLNRNTRRIRNMYGRKACESPKSSEGSTMWEHLH